MPTGTAPTQVLQGIEVPSASINPQQFFALTRRLRYQVKTTTFAGLGGTDNVTVQQAGIISGLYVRFIGQLVVTPGTGTAATTWRWPYDLLRVNQFSANGQSNLINCSGSKLKARQIMALGPLNDRGVVNSVNGASVNQGTMAMASESWGVGQNASAIAAGTYNVDLSWYVPVAMDDVNLVGAIFAQTSATDLQNTLQWANASDLFTLTGNATAALTGKFVVESKTYTIPQGTNGQIIVPDLSTFHAMTQSRFTGITVGDNEVRLAGQGVGKQLMRIFWQVWNGATPAPLAVTAANFGQIGWRYGGNDTPEVSYDGTSMRELIEETFNSDLGGLQGYSVLDFCKENAFRDSVDEGTATELRFLINVASGVTTSNAAAEYVQETLANGAAV